MEKTQMAKLGANPEQRSKSFRFTWSSYFANQAVLKGDALSADDNIGSINA
jgi:hypothetical protein